MIEVAIMVEGQNGLTWKRWQNLAWAVEDLGFAGLYRSDHFTNAEPPDIESLELWVSLTWLASYTRRIEFGPRVSPVSFRHPVFTARMGAQVDDLSGGRLVLGMGAGWQEREHQNFGFDLLPVAERFERFEEGLEVVSRLLHSGEPTSFEGKFYHLNDAILLPRPKRPAGPPILIGGNGPERILPLTARFADEWNAVYIPPHKFAQLNQRLNELLEEQGRQPEEVRRSLMTGLEFGLSDDEVAEKVHRRTKGKRSAQELREHGLVVGTPPEVVAQLQALSTAGVQRVMLQWLNLDDLEGLTSLAERVLAFM